MASEELVSLISKWRKLNDELDAVVAPFQQQISEIQQMLDEAAYPFEKVMLDLESQIKELTLARAQSTKVVGVSVSYRSGYDRVTYNAKQTDVVLAALRDAWPSLAESLDQARKVSPVAPSVSIKAV